MEEILKEKIRNTLKARKDFWGLKSYELSNSLQGTKRKLNEENSKIFEEIEDIDREIKSLEAVIKNSSDLAISLVKPVKERERCIENMTDTKALLECENKLKILLAKIKAEKNDIERKILILLEANDYIKYNSTVFENYRELILKESQDVVKHINTIYDEKTEEIKKILKSDQNNQPNIKEFNQCINSMDKNCLLIYKLTLDKKFMENYFDSIINFVVKLVSRNNIDDITEKLQKQIPKNPSGSSNNSNSSSNLSANLISAISNGLSSEALRNMLGIINQIIAKIFLKLASLINERKQIYFKEFKDFSLVFIMVSVFFCNLESHLEKFFALIYQIIDLLVKIDSEGKELDFICAEISGLISNFEKFKFFISILQDKIFLLYNNNLNHNATTNNVQHNQNNSSNTHNYEEINIYKNKIFTFMKKFNGYLYDLGEKYANYEVKIIKLKLLKIFKDQSKNYNSILEANLKSNYDELAFNIYVSIDDFFYILKISGNRAIETLNIQLCMAIFNNIKTILFDDLLEIIDYKISTVLIKSEFKNKNFAELKYSCKEEPTLSIKYNLANLFLITCYNLIDQSKNNIFMLFEEFRNYLSESIFNSEIFNHNNIVLVGDNKEEFINEQIKYFHKSDVDLMNHLFGEVEHLGLRYEDFLNKKIKLLFEFINPQIKASVDVLNSSNYVIDSKKISGADFIDSFANKFIEDTDKLVLQWKNQTSENCFNKFFSIYADYVAQYVEIILTLKKYNTFGTIILEKVSCKYYFLFIFSGLTSIYLLMLLIK